MYVYMYVLYICMYICLYVFTLGSAGIQLNSYGATGAKGLIHKTDKFSNLFQICWLKVVHYKRHHLHKEFVQHR